MMMGFGLLIVACALHLAWIERDAIELRWEARTDTIARAELRAAVADGECVRLTWANGEQLLIPMMAPHTREGRMRQSEMLAKLLAPR